MSPGGELILWAEELRNKPTVIVNCAGRTRSIIGTAALRRLGLTNVRALRNGTMGWVLAGYQLETKPARRGPRRSENQTTSDCGGTADRSGRKACVDDGGRTCAMIEIRATVSII